MSYPKDQSKLTTERIDKYEFQKCVLEILTLVMTFGLLKMIIIEVLVAYKSFLRSINSYTSKSDEADMTFIKECFVHI